MKKKRAIHWDAALSAGENARLQLPPIAGEYFAHGRSVLASAATPAELHAFRLAAKRFRYTLEIFLPLYGPGLVKRIDAVKKIQNILGKRQDSIVLADRVRSGAQTSEMMRGTLDKLERQGLKLEQEFRAYWLDEFDRAGNELRWMRYLARRPRRTVNQRS